MLARDKARREGRRRSVFSSSAQPSPSQPLPSTAPPGAMSRLQLQQPPQIMTAPSGFPEGAQVPPTAMSAANFSSEASFQMQGTPATGYGHDAASSFAQGGPATAHSAQMHMQQTRMQAQMAQSHATGQQGVRAPPAGIFRGMDGQLYRQRADGQYELYRG
eukprot:gnl/Ergobibamus_cyprinoides/142.p1 GENE.gnl/Ergobibamus_cyprinoides/142~~gnl/Ergobibamus_cyprinoides/142.p1  ORF type:complete len:161 (+),score=6.56 gnl/Ergobibamus_cyprinoides/142:994-1476(+)